MHEYHELDIRMNFMNYDILILICEIVCTNIAISRHDLSCSLFCMGRYRIYSSLLTEVLLAEFMLNHDGLIAEDCGRMF